MSECRSLTNICGNAVAAVVIAHMEGELDFKEWLPDFMEGQWIRFGKSDR